MKTLITILNLLVSKTSNLINKLEKNIPNKKSEHIVEDKEFYLRVTEVKKKQGKGNNKMIITLMNYNNLTANDLLKGIYNTLTQNKSFKAFGKHKIIMVNCNSNGVFFNFHHNVLIQENTSLEMYLESVQNHIKYISESDYAGYKITSATLLEVVVYKVDKFADSVITMNKPKEGEFLSSRKSGLRIVKKNVRPYSTMNNLLPEFGDISLIEKEELEKAEELAKALENDPKYVKKPDNTTHFMPLKPLENLPGINFASLDCETFPYNNSEYTWLVTFTRLDGEKIKFLVDYELFFLNPYEALNNLWINVFNYLTLYHKDPVIVHNLGSFDGYFIYKWGSLFFDPKYVTSLVDPQNRFISIDFKFENPDYIEQEDNKKATKDDKFNNINFKDSMRQFPIGLDDFCKIYNVKGKLSKYNKDWHDSSILFNWNKLIPAMDYGMQDSLCLLEAYKNARIETFNNFSIDILDCVSAPSMAVKIWQTNFLQEPIPILSRNLDSFIRPSYFGGATDFYKAFGELLKYYDVNSLYPSVMASFSYPYEFVKAYTDVNPDELENLFGFRPV